MSNKTIFTCVTCNIAYNDADLQRDHYKTDWHRYNLKRKVAELPPIPYEAFQEKLEQQKVQDNSQANSTEEMFCKLCQKHFTSQSTANHVQSNKHKELVAKAMAKDSTNTEYVIKSDRAAKKQDQLKQYQQKLEEQAAAEKDEEEMEESIVEVEEGDEKDWEDVGDEDEEFDDTKEGSIDLNTCLFCPHVSDSLEAKCLHMAQEHSFFVPDQEHVSDLEGLMRHLGAKVGAYHVCLWCSNKMYRDLNAVQKHMRDKGHQKIKFEGDTLIEYVDFYAYDENDESDQSYDYVNQSSVDMTLISSFTTDLDDSTSEPVFDETFELVLPSGSRIGHRSLFKYYKQSFGHRNMELKQRSNLTIKDKYKAIANNSSYTPTEIQKQRKDMAYFQRWSAKWHAKLGWRANKLQKNVRRQDITF